MGRAVKRRMAKEGQKGSKVRYKQMMRTQMIHNACESLSAVEVQAAMEEFEKNKTATLSYVTTELDENGVPISGDVKELKISAIDVRRMQGVLDSKRANEEQYFATHDK
jgi:hypothetical protein